MLNLLNECLRRMKLRQVRFGQQRWGSNVKGLQEAIALIACLETCQRYELARGCSTGLHDMLELLRLTDPLSHHRWRTELQGYFAGQAPGYLAGGLEASLAFTLFVH